MYYQAETGITAGGGEYTPFWLMSNRFGLSSADKNNGYIRAGIFRPIEKEKRFSYGFGVDLAGAYRFTSNFIIQQAYGELKYRCLGLLVGSKEIYDEFTNPLLSSGALTNSNNARPIPQVRLWIPDYTPIPFTKKWLHIRGSIAFGRFTDDKFQRDFTEGKYRYSDKVLYHYKALFLKVGKESFPFSASGGIEMATQFGGVVHYPNGKVLDMPSTFKDYIRVLIPMGGSSSTPSGEQANIYGNVLGSWHLSLAYRLKDWNLRLYYEHYFEDHSMMLTEYMWKDGLYGLEITLPKNRILSSFVYECLATKDQSGPIYHDATPTIPEQVSAMDNYYNHGYYSGWQHWGMGIGNPLLISPIYNRDNQLYFKSNRLVAHHIGIIGYPAAGWQYRALFSYSNHWGTYGTPFFEVKHNTSLLAEVFLSPQRLKGWQFSLSAACDIGDLIGNNVGALIVIRKKGFLTK
ncbi:MAG: capsule assembly Wzi family protein [Bacteroidales bacterium]|nr:capsule assembly Wzi family protein [Bacteroidales bacterium]